MKRRLLITLLLLVAAANLGLFIWIDQRNLEARHPGSLTALDPEAIHRIRIQRAEGELRFEKTAEGWYLQAPRKGRVREDYITDLKALAVLVPLARYPRQDQPLSRYGLEPPRLTVWLDDTRLDLGSRNAANGRRYVLTADGLYLIADTIWPLLQRPPDAWLAGND
ncbi:MAG: DUF4340 domain-containing protein [Gammaproteobacteria bacterium]|nr:MAG: DUF4340 domain-containing protein [Gammaproteobacteria bacterium]